MEATAEQSVRPQFKNGVQSGISIAIGYFPIALTFGFLAKSTGLELYETVLMSAFVFAGAAQYMALSLIALGTGAAEIIFTTFIVNIRHFLMGTFLNEKAESDSVWKKLVYAFGITDETFAVAASTPHRISTVYLLGLMSVSYGSWVVSSGLGFAIGSSLPRLLQESMSIALYAMFIGLLVPSMKRSAKVVYLALLAGALNSVFTLSGLLGKGWSLVCAALASALITEWAEIAKRRGASPDE